MIHRKAFTPWMGRDIGPMQTGHCRRPTSLALARAASPTSNKRDRGANAFPASVPASQDNHSLASFPMPPRPFTPHSVLRSTNHHDQGNEAKAAAIALGTPDLTRPSLRPGPRPVPCRAPPRLVHQPLPPLASLL